jgi:hypothetical protein
MEAKKTMETEKAQRDREYGELNRQFQDFKTTAEMKRTYFD